nr:hypothetical protein [Tanacetum cinerariifolium]
MANSAGKKTRQRKGIINRVEGHSCFVVWRQREHATIYGCISNLRGVLLSLIEECTPARWQLQRRRWEIQRKFGNQWLFFLCNLLHLYQLAADGTVAASGWKTYHLLSNLKNNRWKPESVSDVKHEGRTWKISLVKNN